MDDKAVNMAKHIVKHNVKHNVKDIQPQELYEALNIKMLYI